MKRQFEMNPLALGLALCLATTACTRLDEGLFRSLTFEQAQASALREDKAVFVDFFATWCVECQNLDATTWKDERVIAWLEENAIPLKIDAEREKELKRRYGVRSYPTLVFIDPDGTERGRLIGYVDAEEFLRDGPEALAGMTKMDVVEKQLEKSPNNPLLRHERGSLLMREGRYEEALEEFLWCWDEGTEHRPSYRGVRGSFLVSDFKELARSYPPAMAAFPRQETTGTESR